MSIAVIANGVLRLASMFVTMWVLERVGRRPVMLIGSLLCALLLSAFVIIAWYQNKTDHSNPSIGYASIVFVFLHSLANPGPSMVGLLLGTELSPYNVRHKVQSVAMVVNGIAALISTSLFPFLLSVMQQYAFVVLNIVPLGLCCLYLFIYMPETRGIEVDEIVKSLIKSIARQQRQRRETPLSGCQM